MRAASTQQTMSTPLSLAAGLFFLLGIAHSYLGERYILMRLFHRPDLPVLFGSDLFTRRTLRMAWHLTTVASWTLAALLLLTANTDAAGLSRAQVCCVGGGGALCCALVSGIGSRGRHLSWVVFLAITILLWIGARSTL